MWDNRCAMHRRDAFDAESRRLMHRTQIKGDKPFFDPATISA
jgi:taurine dioxygenase